MRDQESQDLMSVSDQILFLVISISTFIWISFEITSVYIKSMLKAF